LVHIEKISLRGFKSFGNQRVGIPISKGFTAIVGPNGSGKSNVVDAICFVLGRMSTKSMRAEKFSDLIWVGNNKYPPGSYAEVSLHLNNSDRKLPLDEAKVIISRRVDRSGRSVYRANKRRVTRNEVIDLISMAGIFPEGYNIVLQGDITRLIKMTPLERRMLIDELSGIAEYDLKKEKAMRELSKAEENIRATNLVIDEVLSGLRRLERERDEAVRYQDLQTQIREMRWQFQNNQLRKYKERYTAILERTDQGSARIEEIDSEINQITSEADKRQEREEELERTIEKRLEIDQERVGKQMEEVRAQIVRAQENLKNTQENLERNKTDSTRLEEEIQNSGDKIKDNRNKIRAIEGQSEQIGSSLEELRSRQTDIQGKISVLEEENSRLREELTGVESRLGEARASEAIARQSSSDAAIRVNQVTEELSYLERALEEVSKRMEDATSRKESRGKELGDLEDESSALDEKIGEMKEDLEKYSKTLSGVMRDLEVKSNEEARIEAYLGAMKESQNPIKRAISYILKRRDGGEMPGIIGTVSEMAKVPDEYRVSISAATGPISDYIVVKDRASAERCVDALKKNKAGWANFLPLKDLERMNSRPDEATLGMDGVVGLAMNMVGFEEGLRPLYDFVLGRTIVTSDLPSSKSLPRKFRTVTMDGEVLDPSGIISGGYFDPMESGLASMLNYSQEDLETVSAEVKSLRGEKDNLESELEDLRSRIMSAEKRRSGLDAGIGGISEEINRLVEEIKGLESRKAEVEAKAGDARKRLGESKELAEATASTAKKSGRELGEIEKKRDDLLHQIESPELKKLDKEYREVSSIINTRVTTESKLRSDATALQREIEILEQSQKRYGEDLEKAKVAMSGLRVVIEKIENDIPDLEKELSHLMASRQDIGEDIKQLRTAMNSEKRERGELVQRKNALIEDKNRITVEINSFVYERSQLDIQIHNLEHELSLVDYEYEPVELDDLEEISKRISALEVERSRLEPVNMRAIEAYEEQEEKFNDYKERRDKVMEEREAILQFMEEIEAKKRQVFMEAFNSIATNFEVIFAKLSPGGMGKLLLESEEDPFAGGLDIEAKPAGKEVAVIDSMSGGEKALTALAFIFAVQAYKPSPFYILDEIDAHLDDDNVKRVAELVAETSKGSQFVVVTLRDSMMAQADELIGVSMEESGISKVVGVRMEAGRLVEGGGPVEEPAEAGGAQA